MRTNEQIQTRQQYLFQDAVNVAERDRLIIQHQLLYPSFEATLKRILDEWGLAQKLEVATKNGNSFTILDLGCGEGLFLFDLAAILAQRGLLTANVSLYGLDKDETAIATAEAFSKRQPEPNLNLEFYVYDVTQPLDDCAGLKWQTNRAMPDLQFDFILASQLFEHLPQAQLHLTRIYNQNLKPDGMMFVRDFTFAEAGWLAPHPTMQTIFAKSCELVLSLNAGVDVAQNHREWLGQLGAAILNATQTVLATGTDERGLLMARNFVMITRNVAPVLIKIGKLERDEYETAFAQMFKEFSAETPGHLISLDTVAYKPHNDH